jgi:glycosyltransferase involved in cell wall biosynthesis
MRGGSCKLKVSVIIPYFNSVKYIDCCINSIKASSEELEEIIIVDDGSKNSYLSKFSKDSLVKIITLQKNIGRSNARNIGLIESEGDVVIFVDSDVTLKTNTIRSAKTILKEGADGVIGVITGETDANLSLYSNYKNKYMKYFLGSIDKSKKVNFVNGSFFMIIKEKALKWPSLEYYGEDSLYGKQLYENNVDLRVSKDVQIHHLKQYTLKSLLNNSYCMGNGWMYIMLSKFKLKEKRKCSTIFHAKKSQIFSILLGLLIFPSMAFFYESIHLVLFTILIGTFILNLKYFYSLRHELKYFFLSLVLLPLEYLFMGIGILYALLSYLIKPVSRI